MNPSRPARDATELLAHLGWVQRLARALLRDPAAAEDLAQETLRVTLAQPHDRVGSGPRLRAWLRGVAHRLALDRVRGEASRARREALAAPAEATPDTFEVVERGLRQERVAHAVLELAEPYRSTVLYRYLDELPTREVAARMHVSEEAVRKRLERALAQLRAKLDPEFGTNTRSWAGALLGVPGAAAVTVPTKLAAAAVLVLGAALGWRVLSPAAPEREENPAPARVAAAPAGADGSPSSSPEPTADRAEARRSSAPSREAISSATDATILHVRVVDLSDRPCTAGRLTGFWSESEFGGRPPPFRSVDAQIDGPVTDIVLPVTAASVRLAASVAGQPPGEPHWITGLRPEADPLERHGLVERSVTIEVGAPLAGPILSGRVLVDGEPRVPRGLDCNVVLEPVADEAGARFRVHALDARYEIGPMSAHVKRIRVTSDETVPWQSDVRFAGQELTLDLDLATGRTLRLTAVDRRSGERRPGVELYLSKSLVVERSLFRITEGGHSHYVRTGDDGVAIVRGLPLEGRVEIRRDAATVEAELEMNAGQKLRLQQPKEPLLAIELTRSQPAVLDATVRIDADERPRRVFGRLAPEHLVEGAFGEERAEVHFATIGADGRWHRKDSAVRLDESGRWELEARPDGEYKVWVERERRRVSQVATVHVVDEDVGPVELAPRPGTDLLLRLVRCPPEGFVSIAVVDPGAVTPLGTTRPIHGGTFERLLRLEGPTSILVSCFLELDERESSTNRRVLVDPATAAVVEIDLACERARRVELTLSSGALPSEARLLLLRVGEDGALREEVTAVIDLTAGATRHPLAIAAGRYLYFVVPASAPLVAGVVDVGAASDDVPIRIRCELEAHGRAALGAGVQLEEIGGVVLSSERVRRLGRLPLAALAESAEAVDEILLPADARFTTIE